MVPTFTVVLLTGEASGFALRYRRGYAVDFHHDLPDPARHRSDSSIPVTTTNGGLNKQLRIANQPSSTGLELGVDQEPLRHRFLSYTFPSCSPDTSHPVVLDRPDFVTATPTHPGRSPKTACRQLQLTATTVNQCRSFTSIRNDSTSWRTICAFTPITLTPSAGRGVVD